MLLDKPGQTFDTLRQQLSCAAVSKREFTGVGFWTKFALPDGAQVKRDVPDMTLQDVHAKLPGLEHGAGFILFIHGGVLTTLEGYTYVDDQWPESTDEFELVKTASA